MKKAVLTPTLTILAAAAVLLGLSFALNGVAARRAQAEHRRLLSALLPGSERFVVEPNTGDDDGIRSVHKGDGGYVIQTCTPGYAADITMLVGVSNQGRVTGLVVRDMAETVGLGMQVLRDHAFLAQLLQTKGEAEVGTNVDAITGATVTSKAVVRAVNAAIAYVTGADVESDATGWGG